MEILAILPRANFFSSPPSKPNLNNPTIKEYPKPPIPIPRYPKPLKSQRNRRNAPQPQKPPKDPSLKTFHRRTKYYKPVSDGVIAGDGDRSVIVGESGVSYLLPGAPFEFQYSYSETPKVKPLAIREPAFLPFAPPTMPRPWTGKAPLKKSKEKNNKIPLFDSLNSAASPAKEGLKVMEMARDLQVGKFPVEERTREEILGKPLTRAEIRMLIKPHLSHNRQVNLGRDGLTHNMLELIHSHWRRQRVCKVRCKGVPTVDMDNVCHHLEEKTGGKIIHRVGGVVYLFRGRNYNYRTRPRYPIMLWKPAAPVYPKLIQEAPEGLTKAEADNLRMQGKNLLPICKLAKNGTYINLISDVRNAFEGSPLAKINCQGMHASDYKKLGAKLKELVPCILLSFDEEQILMWRGKDWKSKFPESSSPVADVDHENEGTLALSFSDSRTQNPVKKMEISTPRMVSLWKRAIESSKALLLDEIELGPDALLEKVEAFEAISQATEHSHPALILSSQDAYSSSEVDNEDESEHGVTNVDNYDDNDDEGIDEDVDYISDCFGYDDKSTPLGSLPLDSIAEKLSLE